ncbi:MAG TPA: leucyl/phenylalanyl-tRNA--protein transferase [Planctomycetota bacterium]|nr:leucyl/phenylalanyl-tRNA--protein transferase [Planctomycetota bacterium]
MRERHTATPNTLSPEFLLAAYRMGYFPMGEAESPAISWYRPDPRAVIPLDEIHVPRRLARTIRSGRFRVSYNEAFDQVVLGCRENRPVWITDPIRRAFGHLHDLGHAHSVEVWKEERLVGGIYGLQIGGAFMAESKFHRERDASKVALVKLAERLRDSGFRLLEVQFVTDHLARFGAREIPLRRYLRLLADVADEAPKFAGDTK